MKNTPIKPHGFACNCCTPTGQILSKEKWLDVGFGVVTFIIQYKKGKSLYRSYTGGISETEDFCTKVKDLEEEYGHKFDKAECITLFFNTPLHDETYEFNKEDKQWYLIAQGPGFA